MVQRDGLLPLHCYQCFTPGLARERFLSREHLVKNRAKRKYIATGVNPFTMQLLRRHVRQRANYLDVTSKPCQGLFPRHDGAFVLCQPEIEQHGPAFGEHDVAWFEVAMNDAFTVCRGQCIRNRDRDLQSLDRREPAPLDARRKCLALQVLHRDESSRGIFPKVIHPADACMI